MTPTQRIFYDAMTEQFETPMRIGQRAGAGPYYFVERTSRYCIQLTRLGLAEKGGTRQNPMWRRKPSE